MRLGVHTWLQSLIFFLLFFLSLDSYARPAWSDVGITFPKSYASESGLNNKSGNVCKMSVKGMEEDGDKSKGGQYVKQYLGTMFLTYHQGSDVENKNYGVWEYGYRIYFNTPSKYKQPILDALKNALSNGNCNLINYFANMLVSGEEKENSAGKKGYVYEDDPQQGTSCVVTEDGTASCRRHYLSEDNPDGTKRICVTPEGASGCYEDFTMDELSKKSNTKDDKTTDSGASSGKGDGSSIDDKRGGSNGSSSGSGTGNSGSANGNSNQSGKGDAAGDGSGKGQGGGIGDKEGDGDKDKTEDVEIKAAPTMKETFLGLRDKIKDKFLKDFEINGAECPKVEITLLNRNFTIDQHCDILELIRDFIQSLMMFLYTFSAIRIVLSS